MATKILATLVVLCGIASAQPAKLTIGIYTPTVEFGTTQARLAYAQGLARAIEQSTGIKTEAQAYATVAALKKDAVDYAVLDGPCYATNLGWKLLATATIGTGTTRPWALYSSAGDTLQALRGKKLAYVAMGCNDAGFVDNAMLDSELDASFFGARVGERDLTGAIASVTSYKTAHAVFAPVGAAKGLTKVFDAGAVPNAAFVQLADTVPTAVTEKVAIAVLNHVSSSPIAGWTKPSRELFQHFAARLAPVKKAGVFASPEPVRLEGKDVLLDLPSLNEPALVPVRHHFLRQPGGRME